MYTKVKIGLVPESGEIYYCVTSVKPFWSNMHPDEQIVQLVKISISNVTGVSFGTPKDYILQNLKMMSLTIRSWKP